MDKQFSPTEREGYYQYGLLEGLSDPYSLQPDVNPLFGYQRGNNLAQAELENRQWIGLGSADPIPRYTAPIGYQSFQSQEYMDLNFLSAENYQEGMYEEKSSQSSRKESTQLYGGLLGRATTPDASLNSRLPGPSRKEGSNNSSAEENAPRQRGRPRLNTRDQTAAEVGAPVLSLCPPLFSLKPWKLRVRPFCSASLKRHD